MKLLRALTEKSWQQAGATADGYYATESQASLQPPQKTALLFFLGVVGVMFALFITAYFIRMELADWRPMPEPRLLWVNTLLLFLGSAALQWTHVSVRRGTLRSVKIGLLLGGLLTFGFVYGQVTVWRHMSGEGYYLYNNPANAFFYVLTGVHALHMLGGLWVWTRASFRVWFGSSLARVRLSVELCTVYWHFLLLVWLVLFALISTT